MAQRLVPEAWTKAAEWAGSQRRSLYQVFFALLPMVQEAHRASDVDLLLRGYAFAEWCARHRTRSIWNAAGVAFYEHLFDTGLCAEQVVPWLTSETYADVKGLFAMRADGAVASGIEHAKRARRESQATRIAARIKDAEIE